MRSPAAATTYFFMGFAYSGTGGNPTFNLSVAP